MEQDGETVSEAAAWQRLALAVLVRAWADAHSTNGAKAARELGLSPGVGLADDARLFLESDGAAWLLALLEMDGTLIERIRHELPPLEWRQLALGLEV
jgi:hypothetical protein